MLALHPVRGGGAVVAGHAPEVEGEPCAVVPCRPLVAVVHGG